MRVNMLTINLEFPQEKYYHQGTYAEGYLFDKQEQYYRDSNLINYFSQARSWEEFKELCKEANGSFRIVLKREEEYWLATDHRASYHIYYTHSPSEQSCAIGTNGFDLLKHLKEKAWRKSSLAFFLNKACTPQHYTLLKDLYSLPPATALRIQEGAIGTPERYEEIPSLDEGLSLKSEDEILELFQGELDQASKRFIRHLDGRQAVISLTGGFDSRLIATQLKCFHYENVLCVSYGKEGNEDMRKAKLVAERLDYPFHYIPSVDLDELSDYRNDKEFLDYMHFMTGLSASYYYQEFMPSKKLAQGKLTQENALIITGHQGDGIGGSRIMHSFWLKNKELNLDKLADLLLGHKELNQNFSSKQIKLIKEEIKASLSALKENNPEARAMNLFESFIFNEDYPKYILNSQHSWRYRGFETATLFTDKKLYLFAYSLPAKYRFGKKLYDKMAMQLFENYNINFDDDRLLLDVLNSPSYRLKQWLKPYVKPLLPQPNIFKTDLIGFGSIMQALQEEVKADKRFSPTSINGLSFCWYLKHLEKKLNLPLPKELFD